MIHITDEHEYLAIWYLPGNGCCWLATVYRQKGVVAWTIQCRLRYYADDKLFNETNDFKDWFTGTEVAAPDVVIAKVDKIAHDLVAKGFSRGTGERLWRRTIRDRSARTLYDILKTAPFTHMSTPDGVDAVPTTNERGSA